MPRGRIETQSAISSDSQKTLEKDGNFFPIPTHVGILKVIVGGGDPDLPDGRRIPFFSSFKVKIDKEYDFIKISSMFPTGLIVA